ncbi:TipJ family phage tail tip protein [Maricaulis maris]|uniref:TipJ family phage tail tip protein n=1 Tax=Maricaulis maris TaxID=74318 RepID=UPI003B8D958C
MAARPFADRAARAIAVPDTWTVAEIVEHGIPDPVLRSYVVVELNGREVDRATWADVGPRDGDLINVFVRPCGDDGEKFLRTLLQVAVIAVATWVGGGAGGAIASSFWAAAAASTIMVVGNLLINALIPPPTPSVRQQDRPGTTYTIDGGRNAVRRSEAVLLPMGEHRISPDVMGEPVQEIVGDDMYWRILYSLGPVGIEFDDIKIGETPIGNYDGVEIELRLEEGAPDHTLYANDPHTEQVGALLSNAGGWVSRTTEPGTTEVTCILGFRQGLGKVNDDGSFGSQTVSVEMRYRPVGEVAWQTARPDAPGANAATANLGTTRSDYFVAFPDINQFINEVANAGAPSGSVNFAGSEPGKPVRRTMRCAVPEGQYEVEVRRITTDTSDNQIRDEVHFEALRSTAPTDPVPEKRLATMALRIKATDQLNGIVDQVNGVARRCPPSLSTAIANDPDADLSLVTAADWTTERVSSNNADLALYLYRGPHASNPRSDDQIDWPAWAAFWKWCDENSFKFDYVFASDITRAEAARMICAAARARPIKIGDKLSVVIDGPRADGPRQLFTARTVRNFKITKTFPSEIHALRVPFVNKDNGWSQDEMIVYADGYDLLGEANGGPAGTVEATAIEELQLPGITDPEQIWRAARFWMYTAKLQTERYTFENDIESIASRAGHYALAEHPVMLVGLGSARVKSVTLDGSGDVESLVLDADFTMEAGKSYGIRWRDVVDEGGVARVTVPDGVDVVTEVGTTSVLSLVAPADPGDVPGAGDVVAFGEVGLETVPILIKNINRALDFNASIEAVAYAPTRFTAELGAVPAHSPVITYPRYARPAAPVHTGSNVDEDGIYIRFDFAEGVEPEIDRFEVSWRQSPEASEAKAFSALPPISAEGRVLVAPAGVPGREYDFQIVAVGTDRQRSDPLLVLNVASFTDVPVPTGCTVTPMTETGAAGEKIPGALFVCDAATDPRIEGILVERKPKDAQASEWRSSGVILPATNPAQFLAQPPGGDFDYGFTAVTRRGARSAPRVEVPAVTIPGELVATDATALAGQPAQTVIDDIAGLVTTYGSTASAAASAVAAEAAKTAAEAARDTSQTYRDAAQAAQGLAETAQADAETAKDVAEAAATNSANSATAASQSEVAAAASELIVSDLVRDLLPATMDGEGDHWTSSLGGSPDNATGWTSFADHTSLGRAAVLGPQNHAIGTRGMVRVAPGRIWEAIARFEIVDDGATDELKYKMGVYSFEDDQSTVLDSNHQEGTKTTSATGVIEHSILIGASDVTLSVDLTLDVAAVWFRPHLRVNPTSTPQSDATVQLVELHLRDVTELVEAADHASAAATSASSATAASGAASTSASASSAAQVAAEAARDAAQGSETAAANSATASSGSASTAAGHATDAGNSAAAAATSEQNAQSHFNGAVIASSGVINASFEDGQDGSTDVPAGWMFEGLIGSQAGKVQYYDDDVEPGSGSILSYGRHTTDAGCWQLGKRFSAAAGDTLTASVWVHGVTSVNDWPGSRNPVNETFMAEDDAQLLFRSFDGAGNLIEEVHTDTAAQIFIDAGNTSGTPGDHDLVASYVLPAETAEVEVWIRALDGDGELQSYNFVTGNAAIKFDNFEISSTGQLSDITGATASALEAARASTINASAAASSATASGNSATAAQTAQVAAESARDSALGAETNASDSATAAAGSASAAATSATDAGNSATAAQTAQTAAESARTGAEGAEASAASHASAAAGSASTAATSATDAETAATAAEASQVAADVQRVQVRRDLMSMGAMSPVVVTKDQSHDITAFEPNTQLFKNGVLVTTLANAYDTHTLFAADVDVGDVLEADKPFVVKPLNLGATGVPVVAAGTEFVTYTNRNYPAAFVFFAPHVDARVAVAMDTDDFTSPLYTVDVPAGQAVTLSHDEDPSVSRVWRFKATGPVCVALHSASNNDNHVVWPAARQIVWGRGALNPHAFKIAGTITHHDAITGGTYASEVTAEGVGLFARDTGDGDGSEDDTSMPVEALGDTYLLNHDLEGFRVVMIEEDTKIEIRNAAGTIKQTITAAAGAAFTSPDEQDFGAESGEPGTGLQWSDGPFLFTGSRPFLLRTNDDDGHEYNAIGYRSDLRQSFSPAQVLAAGYHAASSASSAATASGHATDASSSAAAASSSALAASASEGAADTSATDASTSATAANTSASNAQASADAASTSAAAANASELAADASHDGARADIYAGIVPEGFSDLARWRTSAGGDPASLGVATGLVVAVPNIGDVWQRDFAAGVSGNWYPKTVHPWNEGQEIEFTVMVQLVSGGSAARPITFYIQGLDENYNSVFSAAATQVTSDLKTSDGWQTFTAVLTIPPTTNGAVQWRPRLHTSNANGTGSATFELARFFWEDVTSRNAAASSAAASLTSEQAAGTHATAAGSSASASEVSRIAAEAARDDASMTATLLFPNSFEEGGLFWRAGGSGKPDINDPFTNYTYGNDDPDFGNYAEPPAVSNKTIAPEGWLLCDPDKVWEITVVLKATVDTDGSSTIWYRVGLYSATAGHTTLDSNLQTSSANFEVADGVITRKVTMGGQNTDAELKFDAGAYYFRPHLRTDTDGTDGTVGQCRIGSISVREVTSERASAASAAAALTSEGNASASASDAGGHATAASSSAATAQTEASNAAASASTASSAAGDAAVSETNAGNSASSAAGSATAASSSASAASTDAQAAATSASLAAQMVGATVYDHDFLAEGISSWEEPTADMTLAADAEGMLCTSTAASPTDGGKTDGVRTNLGAERERAVAGRKVRVSVLAKKPASNATAEFAVAYSTDGEGNSSWQDFTPTSSFAWYRFDYDIDAPTDMSTLDGSEWIGINADTSAAGKGLIVQRVIVEIYEVGATVDQHASAIASLQTNSAIWSVLVAAAGGEPALVQLLAGEGGSQIVQAAEALYFYNSAGGGSHLKAMEVVNQIVHIIKELRLSDDAAMTMYTGSPGILRACYGKHPSTGKLGRFAYDAAGNPLEEFNFDDGTYALHARALAGGILGARKTASVSSHDFLSSAVSDTNAPKATYWTLLNLTTPECPVEVGGLIEPRLSYLLKHRYNAFEWFCFWHRVRLIAVYDDDTEAETYPYDTIEFDVGGAANTGGGPATGTNYLKRVPFFETGEPEVATGYPWVNGSKVLRGVKAKVQIDALDRSGGNCVFGGTWSPSYLRDDQALENVVLSVRTHTPDLTET